MKLSMSLESLVLLSIPGRTRPRARIARFATVVICGIGLGLVGGCNKSDLPSLGKVEGHVTLDGKPVAGATVVFEPVPHGRRLNGINRRRRSLHAELSPRS